ncbi:MAG: hypothetical protein LBQ46_10800 [Treponema sp.]|nr:hypothetical protein [Treponema sp.]
MHRKIEPVYAGLKYAGGHKTQKEFMMKNKLLVSVMLAGLLALGFAACNNGSPGGDTYYFEQWDVYSGSFSAFEGFSYSSFGTGLTGAVNVATNGTFDEIKAYWEAFEADSTITRDPPLNGVMSGIVTKAGFRNALKEQTDITDAMLDQMFNLIDTRGNCIVSVDARNDAISRYILVYVEKQ